MDEAGAKARIAAMTRPPELKVIEAEIESIRGDKEVAIKEQDFEKAAHLRDKEKSAKKRYDDVLENWRTNNTERIVDVTEDDILSVVSKWTGVPLQRMEQAEAEKLLKMEGELKQRVIGQDEAVIAISKALRRSRADLKDPKRPIGSFIFLGPTGVGKTFLAKNLAEFMFGSQEALIQLDMSEYMEKHTASRLIGAPPGYVGYEEGGQLSEAVRRRPYSVVLFDEVEKAHPDVMHLLLQILEEGQITDNFGRRIDFRNTVIILTSNIGAETIKRQTTLGFGAITQDVGDYNAMKDKVMEAAKKFFKPEFINRLDDIVCFRMLERPELTRIVDLEIAKVLGRLKSKRITLTLDDSAREFLIKEGYDPQYGARPMRRAVEKHIEDPLAEALLGGDVREGDTVKVVNEPGAKVLKFVSLGENPEPPAAVITAADAPAGES
jgi:ATP-dependent Clp protease ATP-binding subunit ClpC